MAFQAKALKNYNKFSRWQLEHSLRLAPNISHCLNQVQSLLPKVIYIADYGSSEGNTSMMTFEKVFSEFRSHSSTPIHLTHTDLPENNWNELYKTINLSPNSYTRFPNISYSTIGKSFYNQLLPPNSLHLGYSTNSFQYLSKIPPRSCNPRMIFPEASIQLKSDLKINLSHRINELTKQGLLIFSILAKSPGGTIVLDELIFKPLESLFSQKIITENEYRKIYSPSSPLDESELWEVLKCFQGQIDVKSFEYQKSVSPFYTDFVNGGKIEEYKTDFANMMGVFVRNMLGTNLEGSDERKENVYNQALTEIKDKVTGDEIYLHYYTVVIQKV